VSLQKSQNGFVLHFFSICCTAEKIFRSARVTLHMHKRYFSDIPIGFFYFPHKRRPIVKNRRYRKNLYQWLAFFTLVCTLGVSITGCYERGRAGMERIDVIMDKISRELDLDDSQKIKLNAIKVEIQKRRSRLADRRKERFNELLVQIRSDQMDGKWMKQRVIDYTETVLRNSDRFIEQITVFQQSLRPEQKEALAVIMLKHKEKLMEETS
jgi:periplasmic protein CpxP/Spy